MHSLIFKNKDFFFYQVVDNTMKYTIICISLVLAAVIYTAHCDDDDDKKPKKLQIGIQKRAENCPMKSRKGDTLHMQYRVNLMFNILLTF